MTQIIELGDYNLILNRAKKNLFQVPLRDGENHSQTYLLSLSPAAKPASLRLNCMLVGSCTSSLYETGHSEKTVCVQRV